jgi:hypothetical protein
MRTKTKMPAEDQAKSVKPKKTVQFKENEPIKLSRPKKPVAEPEREEGEVSDEGQQIDVHATASQETKSIGEASPKGSPREKETVVSETAWPLEGGDEQNSQAWPESEEAFYCNGDTIVRVVSGQGIERTYTEEELNELQSLPY